MHVRTGDDKNRNREKPTFANINLLGECNANCFFCLGKDIPEHLAGKNQLSTHFSRWKNFDAFLDRCREADIRKLYVTGQTADGLQYRHLDELTDALQADEFDVGVRTNGYLAERKMDVIRKMRGEIGFSIHSLDPETNHRIMRRGIMPDWRTIIPASGPNVRVSIVVNRYNEEEFFDLVRFASEFPNVRYVQARRVSTDTRCDELATDQQAYARVLEKVREKYRKTGTFYAADQYDISGKEVCFWPTVRTSCNSFNYFTDGTVSEEYFIVEGYLKNMRREIGEDECT